jgi:hypothetical protein
LWDASLDLNPLAINPVFFIFGHCLFYGSRIVKRHITKATVPLRLLIHHNNSIRDSSEAAEVICEFVMVAA